MIDISNALVIISQAISVLPLVVGIICFRFLKSYLRPIFLLTIVAAFTEIIIYLFRITNHNILVGSYTYTLIEFILLSLFYIRFFSVYFKTYIFTINIFVFLLLCFISSCFFGNQLANQYNTAVESLVLTCYCLYLFYFLIKNLLFDNLLETPVFWINTAVLFYFTGNLMIFVFNAYIAGHLSERNALLWNVTHTFFNVSMNILFSIGFWKARAK